MDDLSVSSEGRLGAATRRYERVALVLQGGGALGAYQAGVYESLAGNGIEPDWISGVSIGAINAALICGNEPARRVERLRAFWERISGRKIWAWTPDGDVFRAMRNQVSAWYTTSKGQPGFFTPRPSNPWLQSRGAVGATSFYDTEPLRETLLELVDFDLINSRRMRFSVGAVNVRTGNFVYFDNRHETITPEHVMASGALPPAFPPVEIDGEYYWDGGIVSNTPLQHLLDQEDGLSSLVFQVDLFSARGELPRDMRDVQGRHKDIMYSSRTRYNTDTFSRLHRMKRKLAEAITRLPADQRTEEDKAILAADEKLGAVNIILLIYQQRTYEGSAKDHEFSGTSMREHWQTGFADTARTLRHRSWLDAGGEGSGVVVHDLHRDHDMSGHQR